MRSLLGPVLRNQTPISYAPTGSRGGWLSGLLGGFGQGAEAQMRAMGSVGTLFAIVNRTSTKTAAVDWHLYRKAKSGKKEDREEVTSHACLDLWNKPNKHMPRQEFVEVFQQHLDLTGEAWWVVARNPRSTLPLELWPVRPDRMEPVPDPDEYLAGYTYTSPDGRQVPLKLDEVIQLRMPNPLDPYRGMGPVQSILVDLDTERYTKEWNRRFFKNSAVPGGIVEVEKNLSDTEFDEFNARWREQHQGVGNAHRVAMLEHGAKWVSRTFSMRDMQFAELRTVGRDVILEAFGAHKMSIGVSDDVNLANAMAGKAMFAEDLTVPRCERIKGSLNNDLLPLYGATTKGLEWDYDSPVPSDAEAENAERTSKAEAAKALVDAGYDPKDVAEAMGLPPMAWRERIEATTPAAPAVVPAAARAALPAPRALTAAERWQAQVANLLGVPDAVSCDHTVVDVDETDIPPPPDGTPEKDVAAVEEVDLTAMQVAFEAALAALVLAWMASIITGWIDDLVDAVKRVLTSGQLADLATITVDTDDAATRLLDSMVDLAESSASHVVTEAAAQDVVVEPVVPDRDDLKPRADTTAALEGQRYAAAAAREASRMAGGDLEPDEIGDYVRTKLESLSEASVRSSLAGALTGAQNTGRTETFRSAPVGALYASEVLDGSTCPPCRSIHGRWVANTDDMETVRKLYPGSGYINCRGDARCRGTIVGVWRPQQVKEDA